MGSQGQVFHHVRRQNPTTRSLTHFLQKLRDHRLIWGSGRGCFTYAWEGQLTVSSEAWVRWRETTASQRPSAAWPERRAG